MVKDDVFLVGFQKGELTRLIKMLEMFKERSYFWINHDDYEILVSLINRLKGKL